jgi:hypothetical protein
MRLIVHGTKIKLPASVFINFTYRFHFNHFHCISVAYPGFFFFWGGGSTNSVDDRGQRERISGGGSPLVRGSTQFANE